MTTNLSLTEVAQPYEKETATPQLTALTFAAGDATNGNDVSVAQDVLLIFNNTDASPQTVTIYSGVDPYGRSAEITDFSIPAGGFVARRFSAVGWENTLGGASLQFLVDNVAIEVVAIPV